MNISKRTKAVIEAKLGHSQTSGIRPSVLVCLFFLCYLKFVKIFISKIPKQKYFRVKTGMCLFFLFVFVENQTDHFMVSKNMLYTCAKTSACLK